MGSFSGGGSAQSKPIWLWHMPMSLSHVIHDVVMQLHIRAAQLLGCVNVHTCCRMHVQVLWLYLQVPARARALPAPACLQL